MRFARHSLLLATVLTLGGCASMPEDLVGDYPAPPPSEAESTDVGTAVRWGGRLLGVEPRAERSCFEILARPLDKRARPISDTHETGRRFLACREGFSDPAAFAQGTDITVTGTLTGFQQRAIGEFDYRYPVVAVDALHLWPERQSARLEGTAAPYWWYGHHPHFGHFGHPGRFRHHHLHR